LEIRENIILLIDDHKSTTGRIFSSFLANRWYQDCHSSEKNREMGNSKTGASKFTWSKTQGMCTHFNQLSLLASHETSIKLK